MIEYGEATAIRRATRLVRDSAQPNFSVLNIMVVILLIAIVIMAFKALVGGT